MAVENWKRKYEPVKSEDSDTLCRLADSGMDAVTDPVYADDNDVALLDLTVNDEISRFE